MKPNAGSPSEEPQNLQYKPSNGDVGIDHADFGIRPLRIGNVRLCIWVPFGNIHLQIFDFLLLFPPWNSNLNRAKQKKDEKKHKPGEKGMQS